MKTLSIHFTGLIQGVGFRPFIYRLAKDLNLQGWVRNTGDGVHITIEGDDDYLTTFTERVGKETPPGSYILSMDVMEIEPEGFDDFNIIESTEDKTVKSPIIPPDVSVCDKCEREMNARDDRRFEYPFISCTFCGPRFSLIKALPYDRPTTTMWSFYLCEKCSEEYTNPLDRRFHAQTTGCERCGPRLSLIFNDDLFWNSVAIKKTIELLENRKIIAIKGVGGYCLACDGENSETIKRIKEWKSRGDKPLAIMVRDIQTVRSIAVLSEFEENILKSPSRPILLLKIKEESTISSEVAPGLNRLGIMLPNTPLQHQLLQGDFTSLVMTSANRRSEPIIHQDDEILELIGQVVDGILMYDRPIHTKVDDSVGVVFDNIFIPNRLARGFSPLIIPVSDEIPQTLAFGSDMKNTFTFIKDGLAYVSQHIGDLENEKTFQFYISEIKRYKKILSIEPAIFVSDMSPAYFSSVYCKEVSNKNNIRVQHHHAHLVSVIAEEKELEGTFLGISADGTGYGIDGEVWGCEFLEFTNTQFRRFAHLNNVPLPGGEEAIRNPYRMGLTYLQQVYQNDFYEVATKLYDFLSDDELEKIKALIKFSDERLSIKTSSLGRLFDAVSSLVGVCHHNAYDAQASILLEAKVLEKVMRDVIPYKFDIGQNGVISVDKMIEGIVMDRLKRISMEEISTKFHKTVGDLIYNTLKRYYNDDLHSGIVISGGVFQNLVLLRYLVSRLRDGSMPYYINKRVPPNDAGISLGQAIIGANMFLSGVEYVFSDPG